MQPIEEMFKEIVATEPEKKIGTDNMTAILVKLYNDYLH